ncbi:potassium transporter TrkA (plasmid) [Halorussus limi]|uniref:Potassium transporter TrkA n=1 Tax=Halorussus limi TaxID=2938695 RepID=A0A8U0I0F2_9EURY|nr:TrkA C-terminal domain-containing protein [Halorussus limi]UPV76503.1 potassium transporter TrkA [Halorussus limi]
MTVYETDLPGVGRKFEYEIDGDDRLVVLIHHDGRREVFRRPSAEADSEKLFELSDRQAREFGTLLEGAYFQPVDLERVQVPLGEEIIEWHEVGPDSSAVGRSLADSNVRHETGTSVLAVQRADETVGNPPPEFELSAGDVVVALGTRAEHRTLSDLLSD